MVSRFDNLASVGVQHFSRIFREDIEASTAQMMRIIALYPSYVSEEHNQNLMEAITLEELRGTVKSLQKEKSPGPGGWPAEFFSFFLNLFENDLLMVVEDSRSTGNILAAFNTTFIPLIPKCDY